MATALIVTFTAYKWDPDGYYSCDPVGITSQTLTFVDIGPAQKALEAIQNEHANSMYSVVGTILKDVVI